MRKLYDIAMPPEILKIADRCRNGPDITRIERKVKLITRGNRQVRKYPWEQMKAGDYFFVDLGTTRFEAFRIMVAQQSVILDTELIVKKYNAGTRTNPLPGAVVIMSVSGIRHFKRMAQVHHGANIVLSNLERVKARKSKARTESAKRVRERERGRIVKVTPRPPSVIDLPPEAVERDIELLDTELPPETIEQDTELLDAKQYNSIAKVNVHAPGYDREALMRERMAKWKIDDDED